VRRAQLLVRQVVRVHDDRGALLDVRLDLDLPLVRHHRVDGLDRRE
jgi:hypothetical protein